VKAIDVPSGDGIPGCPPCSSLPPMYLMPPSDAWNITMLFVAPKLEPWIVICAPTLPEEGERYEMVGCPAVCAVLSEAAVYGSRFEVFGGTSRSWRLIASPNAAAGHASMPTSSTARSARDGNCHIVCMVDGDLDVKHRFVECRIPILASQTNFELGTNAALPRARFLRRGRTVPIFARRRSPPPLSFHCSHENR
jgi:hypothetical protein